MPTRTSVWGFTDDQQKRLLPIWDNDKEAFSIFNREIAPAMTQACRPKVTRGEKRELQKKAAKSADKFIDDFIKCDLFWELSYSEKGKKEIEALGSLRRKLAVLSDELHKRDKRTSKRNELAASVGVAMAKSGLKVSSYDGGNAAEVIDICIEAVDPDTKYSLRHLAAIAMIASKMYSK